MNILISGASGIIGSKLIQFGLNNNWNITVLTYSSKIQYKNIKSIPWNPDEIISESIYSNTLVDAVRKADVIINLSGESVAKSRLTKHLKHKVLNSRLMSTKALCKLLEITGDYNKTWLQASGIGYYKSDFEKVSDESGIKGSLFLSEVCDQVETLFESQIKGKLKHTFIMRLGLVVAKNAPAWKKIVFPIKMGLGSGLGSGNQYWSWIHLNDVVAAISFLINKLPDSGVYNFTTPNSETQLNFTKKIASRLSRPMIFPPVPAFLLRLVVGAAVDELVLPSHNVYPKQLLENGFKFKFPTLDDALNDLID